MKNILLLAIASWMAVASVSSAGQSDEAKVECKSKFNRLRKGAKAWPMEGSYLYFSIPECVEGYKIALREWNTAVPLQFKVKEAGLVRLAASGLSKRKLLNEGWVEIGEIRMKDPEGVVMPIHIFVFEKQLAIGDYSIPSEGDFGVRLLMR